MHNSVEKRGYRAVHYSFTNLTNSTRKSEKSERGKKNFEQVV